jgi:hypothetical protein
MRWVFRKLLAVIGAALLLHPAIVVVVRGILAIIGRAGDLDFIISRFADPGWMLTALTWFLNPPGWFLLSLSLMGLVLIALNTTEGREKIEQQKKRLQAAIKKRRFALIEFNWRGEGGAGATPFYVEAAVLIQRYRKDAVISARFAIRDRVNWIWSNPKRLRDPGSIYPGEQFFLPVFDGGHCTTPHCAPLGEELKLTPVLLEVSVLTSKNEKVVERICINPGTGYGHYSASVSNFSGIGDPDSPMSRRHRLDHSFRSRPFDQSRA